MGNRKVSGTGLDDSEAKPSKNERNIREPGLSFERAADFDFETAIYFEDRGMCMASDEFALLATSKIECMHWFVPFVATRSS
jgi:hypothetical protein